MLKHQTIHLIVAVLLAVGSIAHLLRFIYGIPITFGNWQVPVWLSFVGFLIAGYLSIIVYKSRKK